MEKYQLGHGSTRMSEFCLTGDGAGRLLTRQRQVSGMCGLQGSERVKKIMR
jgi:hypothetical protein